jgi:photosystem II protein
MMTARAMKISLQTRFAGTRLQTKPRAARPAPILAATQAAFFSKTKATAAAPRLNKKTGKVLTSGKDIKAQQFTVGLGKDTKATFTLGFTKSNELFVGRLAMLGIATAIIGELITGKGALGQLGLETGVPITELEPLILAGIAFNLIAAFLPAKGKFVPDEEEELARPKGALQDPSISLANPKKFFGIKGFGFTKENELFVGRVAQLGFAAALVGEAVTGVGPLAQLGLETGIPLREAEPLLLASIFFTLFAAINEGSGKFIDED